MTIRENFRGARLTAEGFEHNDALGLIFSDALDAIEKVIGSDGRDQAVVRTKLEEACFFAKRANSFVAGRSDRGVK